MVTATFKKNVKTIIVINSYKFIHQISGVFLEIERMEKMLIFWYCNGFPNCHLQPFGVSYDLPVYNNLYVVWQGCQNTP